MVRSQCDFRMNKVKVLLFGPARDAAAGSEFVYAILSDFPFLLTELREALHAQHNSLRFVLANSIFALDNKLVPVKNEDSTTVVGSDSEIVLIPPVSGG